MASAHASSSSHHQQGQRLESTRMPSAASALGPAQGSAATVVTLASAQHPTVSQGGARPTHPEQLRLQTNLQHLGSSAQDLPGSPQSVSSGAISERAQVAVQQVKGMVQGALQQQHSSSQTAQQKLEEQIVGLNKLLQTQALGLQHTQKQISELEAAILPRLAPTANANEILTKIKLTHSKILELHMMLQKHTGILQASQSQAQKSRLEQTQRHVSGMFQMVQDQTIKLDRTQAQVAALQKFAKQAQVQVQRIAAVHENNMKHAQDQIHALETRLAEQEKVQERLQEQLHGRANQPIAAVVSPGIAARADDVFPEMKLNEVPGVAEEVVKSRADQLTAELLQLMQLQRLRDPDEDSEVVSDESV